MEIEETYTFYDEETELEFDLPIVIDAEIVGRYRPATLEEPPEYPEFEGEVTKIDTTLIDEMIEKLEAFKKRINDKIDDWICWEELERICEPHFQAEAEAYEEAKAEAAYEEMKLRD